MSLPRFELLEHTADAGVAGHGRTIAEAFEQTALGMYALMVDLGDVREAELRTVEAEGETLESLLMHWLAELLFLTETTGLLFRWFEVSLEDGRLVSTARGETMDPDRHDLGAAIKGVTRHRLEVAEEDGGYRTRVLFDI